MPDSPRPRRIRLNDEPPADALSHDRLEGARQISMFWFGSDQPRVLKKTFLLIEQRRIPTGRLGGRIIASKRVLREHYEHLASGQE